MATPSSSLTAPRAAASRKRLFVLVSLLVLLSILAVYVWTLPARREKALRAASISQLIALGKKEPNNSRVFYHLGLRLHSMGQIPPARAAFERAAELDDEDEEAWLAWAAAAGNLGNDQEAFSALRAFTQAHPKAARARKALATFYYAQEAMPRAYEEALATTKLDPKDGAAWRLAGLAAIELENYVEAAQAFREAVKLDPNDWRAVYGLGNALDRGESRQEALAMFQRANALAPNEPMTTLSVGRMLLTMATKPDQVRAARETLERASAQNPSDDRAFVWLGRAYARAGELQKARETLERAKTLAPKAFDVAYELRQVYARLGDTARAAQESKRHKELQAYALEAYNLLARLHEASPEQDRQLRLKLSRLYAAHGDYAKAAREYRQLVRRAPDLEAAKRELAEIERKLPAAPISSLPLSLPNTASTHVSVPTLLQDGDAMMTQQRYSEAQNAFQTARQRDPNQAKAAEGLGLALEAQRKDAEAFQALNQALSLDPSLPKAQFAVAKMYYNAGLPDEATRRMEKLIRQVSNEPEYFHKLGICYLSTNRPQQAAGMFARAADLAPDNAAYWNALAQAETKNEKATQAEEHYRRGLRLAPNDADTLVRLGTLLLDRQATAERQQEAERLFRSALATNPQNALALLGMGRLQNLQKDPRAAVSTLESLIAKNPDTTQAYYELARAYTQLGNKERADYCRKVFRAVTDFRTERDNTEEQVRLNLKNAPLRLKLARLYARDDQRAKAINQYQMCLHLDPKNIAARQELEALVTKLKAAGQLPSMTAFQEMVATAAKTQ